MNFDRSAKWALLAACMTLAVCGVGFQVLVRSWDYYLLKEPVDLRRPLSTISKTLAGWNARGDDAHFSKEMEEELGTQLYLDRDYVREDDPALGLVNLHIAYYTGMIDAVPHVPDRCMAASGWAAASLPETLDLPIDRSRWISDPDHANLASGEPYPVVMFAHPVTGELAQVRMPVGEFEIRTVEFHDGDNPDRRIFAGYFFVANGHTVPRAEGVRRYAFDLTTRYAYYTKVQLTMVATERTTADDFIAVAAELTGELLPQLMLCLPDWADVEAASATR